jgi:hypothetical protein
MSGPPDADPVAVWDRGDVVYVALLPRGPITVLEGSALTIWRAATSGPFESTAERVAQSVGLEPEEVRETVVDFLDRLVSQGLIPRSR